MLDYKGIIIKRYAPGLSYKELTEGFSVNKSGINDFTRAFERCEKFRKESQTMQSTNWYTVMSQVSTDKMPAMNSLISP